MGLLYTTFGVWLGSMIKVYVNAVTKRVPRREPWEYLMYGGAGGYIFHKLPAFEAELIDRVNYRRAAHNLPPLERVGGLASFTPVEEAARKAFGKS